MKIQGWVNVEIFFIFRWTIPLLKYFMGLLRKYYCVNESFWHCYSSTDQIRYGSYMAVPVPADCHWRLDGGEVLFDQTLHRRTFCTGVWSYCWRGLLLSSGRDWTRQTHQASDLGHGRPREVQVHLVLFDDIYM